MGAGAAVLAVLAGSGGIDSAVSAGRRVGGSAGKNSLRSLPWESCSTAASDFREAVKLGSGEAEEMASRPYLAPGGST